MGSSFAGKKRIMRKTFEKRMKEKSTKLRVCDTYRTTSTSLVTTKGAGSDICKGYPPTSDFALSLVQPAAHTSDTELNSALVQRPARFVSFLSSWTFCSACWACLVLFFSLL